MSRSFGWSLFVVYWASVFSGCSTMKQSDTARTGIEQLLISSATDQTLDKIDFRTISDAKVYVETKYLDCVDKNYIIVALHQRLLKAGCTLVDKPEDSQVTLEVASGGVGTDRTDMFVGSPAIPLPPPSPISLPRMPIIERTQAMGTAKLAIVAYDTKTRAPVINSGFAMARADHKTWTVLGVGGMHSGRVPQELSQYAGETDSVTSAPREVVTGLTQPFRR